MCGLPRICAQIDSVFQHLTTSNYIILECHNRSKKKRKYTSNTCYHWFILKSKLLQTFELAVKCTIYEHHEYQRDKHDILEFFVYIPHKQNVHNLEIHNFLHLL